MSDLGKSQSGEAATALAALATCCADLAASSGAKAAALTGSIDAPMRDLVRCGTRARMHAVAAVCPRSRHALLLHPIPCRSLQGVHGALAARHAAHTTHLAMLSDVESKRAKLTKLRCVPPRTCALSPAPNASMRCAAHRSESGKADAPRLAGEERDLAAASVLADTARHEYEELCERMSAELLRADAGRAAQLPRDGRDQAAAFDLMRVRA